MLQFREWKHRKQNKQDFNKMYHIFDRIHCITADLNTGILDPYYH